MIDMYEYIRSIADRMAAALTDYQLVEVTASGAVFTSEDSAFRVEYCESTKTFDLYRGADSSNLVKTQSYLFDPAAGDDMRQADSAAYDFIDALTVKPKTAKTRYQRAATDTTTGDESSALFFVNRIPGILPECRQPMIDHKAHYETLLPEKFCDEVVTVALGNMLRSGKDGDKLRKFCELLSAMYLNGNLDTKSIIVQTILNSVTRPADIEYIEDMLSEELRRSWASGRKFIGKTLPPEKDSYIRKLGNYNARALNGQR